MISLVSLIRCFSIINSFSLFNFLNSALPVKPRVSIYLQIAMNCSTVMRHDPEIWQIVHSQSLAYFAGDKSLEETAEQIQSRVSLYMAEQG